MAISSAAGRGAWAENAVDTLAAHFEQAHNSLLLAEHRLEVELAKTYGSETNPTKLLSRINKIQQELPLLEAECRKLFSAKQEFMERTLRTLIDNRNVLHGLKARAGLSTSNEDEVSAFTSVEKILQEWNTQNAH